jgi:uncharacterized protein YndB with AHSA1/START domain
MGMLSKSAIDIAASPDQVFGWLVEPAKVLVWAGTTGGYPEDRSTLSAGYTSTMPIGTPGGERTGTFTLTEYDPPKALATRLVYDGGDQLSSYRLTEQGSGTRLEVTADTDWGAMDMSALETAMAAMTPEQQATVKAQLEQMKAQLAAGAYDAGTAKQLQDALDQSLAKLKTAIEG